ncbi:MAG: hypothetical protein WBX03_13200 [Terriglobales bacterium]|jgi:hypothetical protein
MSNTDATKYGRLTALLVAAWLAFSFTASKLLIFHAGSRNAIVPQPLPLGLAVVVPIFSFCLWFAVSRGFRQFALSLNPVALTIVQTWRIGGITFVVLAGFHLLPAVFALPAGLGDFAIGVTAPLVAFYLVQGRRKNSFILWNTLGVIDLVNAVTLGVLASSTAGILRPAVSTDAMTVLPLSLIPTFAVPLLLILHVISIAQALRWQTRTANSLHEPAAQAPAA